MTALADLLDRGREMLGPAAPVTATSGSFYLVPQSTPIPAQEIQPHANFQLPLSPGFNERPVWGGPPWLLKSFQLAVSGSVVSQIPLEFKPAESLDVTLVLRQNGSPVWSQELHLPLLEVIGSQNTEFTFSLGVPVDLQNAIVYEGGASLAFSIEGITPAFYAGPPPFDPYEAESLERLEQIEADSVSIGQTLESLQDEAEGTNQTLLEVLEAAGVSNELLERIAEELEAEEEESETE